MKRTVFVQGASRQRNKLHSFLRDEIAEHDYKRVSVCAAYASYRGVVLARSLFSKKRGIRYRWLLGLDDNLTSPEAIKVANRMRGAEARIAWLLPKRRFHPKAYLLDSNRQGSATLIVGSCNLTEWALEKNCEVYAIRRARTRKDVKELQDYWASLWNMGKPVRESSAILVEYEKKHKRTRRHNPIAREESHSKSEPTRIVKAATDSLGNSPLAWIVLGKNTGGGNQLDVVKDLAPFLRLPLDPTGGTTRYVTIKSAVGSKRYQITFTKGMWRFMNLQQGFTEALRPDLPEPSPYVLVIERPKDTDTLSMTIVKRNSKRAKDMMKKSREVGFYNRSVAGSSGRRYGWL